MNHAPIGELYEVGMSIKWPWHGLVGMVYGTGCPTVWWFFPFSPDGGGKNFTAAPGRWLVWFRSTVGFLGNIWGFPKSWGYPNSWTVSKGKSEKPSKIDGLGVPPWLRKPPYLMWVWWGYKATNTTAKNRFGIPFAAICLGFVRRDSICWKLKTVLPLPDSILTLQKDR